MKRKSRKTSRRSPPKFHLLETLAHLFHPRHSNRHRPRVLHPEVLVYFCLIILAVFSVGRAIRFFPGLNDNILGYASNITVEQVIDSTNEQRVIEGMPQLALNDELSMAAEAKGRDMFEDQYWAHTAPDGVDPWDFIKDYGYVYKVAGENLARDFDATNNMMEAWMGSATHRANIMNPKFEEIGIAVVDGKLDGFETTLVVQMFGTPGTSGSQIGNKASKTTQIAKKAGLVEEKQLVEAGEKETVLAGTLVTPELFSTQPPLFNPLQLTKAFFLAVVMLIGATLLYDSLVVGHRRTKRMVGSNLGHLMLMGTVAFLLIFFKGGMVK